MSSISIKTLGKYVKPSIFDTGTGALLPEAYRKFYKEWKETEPTAVHWIPEEGKWKRDEVTGEVRPIQNVPIPTLHVHEANQQLWGGEGIVQGFRYTGPQKRRVPHIWFPKLYRSVVYTEILDKHMSVIVTNRTIHLINTHYGFDHYLLKTPACDLNSILALSLKRQLLQELQNGCSVYAHNPEKQKEVYDKYNKYLEAYTAEEIEWYGYSFTAACKKLEDSIEAEQQQQLVPLKHMYRSQLIEKLREAGIREAQEKLEIEKSRNWLQKMNPFGKNHET